MLASLLLFGRSVLGTSRFRMIFGISLHISLAFELAAAVAKAISGEEACANPSVVTLLEPFLNRRIGFCGTEQSSHKFCS